MEPSQRIGKRARTPLPRDFADLMLAPVALLVDWRLEEMAALDPAELRLRIAMDTDREGSTPEQRARDAVDSVCHLLDLNGWEASWEDRGLRLSHERHTFVLGVPPNLRAYVESGYSPA
jgi:hypothetical protein